MKEEQENKIDEIKDKLSKIKETENYTADENIADELEMIKDMINEIQEALGEK